MSQKQLDNGSFVEKLLLRRKVLKQLVASGAEPIIVETNGGYGELYRAAYAQFERGCVFEKDADKANELAKQRPTWAVYRKDCVQSLAAGLGAHLAANLVDVDPYGDPWPIIDAWFESKRPRPDFWLIVNDGMRQGLRMNRGWALTSLGDAAARYGNERLHDLYLTVCRDLLTTKAKAAGYELHHWTGYHCGKANNMTHYAAFLKRLPEDRQVDSLLPTDDLDRLA